MSLLNDKLNYSKLKNSKNSSSKFIMIRLDKLSVFTVKVPNDKMRFSKIKKKLYQKEPKEKESKYKQKDIKAKKNSRIKVHVLVAIF